MHINTQLEGAQMLTLPEAVAMIDKGHKFGEVYPFLEDQELDGPQLKFYFLYHRMPEARRSADPEDTPLPKEWLQSSVQKVTANVQRPYALVPTGDICRHCGGFLMQDGTCKKCTTCGHSDGACS